MLLSLNAHTQILFFEQRPGATLCDRRPGDQRSSVLLVAASPLGASRLCHRGQPPQQPSTFCLYFKFMFAIFFLG